jgi:hypothetical protein
MPLIDAARLRRRLRRHHASLLTFYADSAAAVFRASHAATPCFFRHFAIPLPPRLAMPIICHY